MITQYASTHIIMVPNPSISRLEIVALCPFGPQSFFKALFIRTKLGDTLERIILTKVVTEGRKPQECERGSGHGKQSPYVPEKDNLQEAIKTGASTIKLLLTHKVKLRASEWTSLTPEQFIMHI